MLVEDKVRKGYWVMSYLAHSSSFVCALSLQKVMYRKRLIEISHICEPLVRAGLLERTPGKRKTGYRLAKPAEEIRLVDIHRAFDHERHFETSSIALFIDKCLGDRTLEELVDYEEEDLKDLVYGITL